MEKFMFESDEMKKLVEIYRHFQDDESREIYMARSMYSLSDDKNYMRKIVRNMKLSKLMIEKLKQNSDKEYVLFGAGTWGKAISFFFPEIKWSAIVDNNKAGSRLDDNEIISYEELKNSENTYFVISILFNYEEVERQLLSLAIKKENILVLGREVEMLQYLDLPELQFSKEEVYLDIGGYNGKSAFEFVKKTNTLYKAIHIFEPNKALFESCKETMKNIKRCNVYNLGVWDKTGVSSFLEDEAGSRIVDNSKAEMIVETICLDNFIQDETVTYIKMDIEGAELSALKGARELIIRNQPKLAISIYHRRSDIWDIPKLLLSYNPEYKFYLRTYSFTGNDTILYAI